MIHHNIWGQARGNLTIQGGDPKDPTTPFPGATFRGHRLPP